MRNRILKKEFWCDEKIIELTPVERLLFLGMTNFADDEGIQVYSAKGLKAKVFPADNISVSIIDNGLIKMEELGLIEFGNDRTLIRIRNWKLHQKINRPYPSKFNFIEQDDGDSLNVHGTLNEDSMNTHSEVKRKQVKEKKKLKEVKLNKKKVQILETNQKFEQFYKDYPRKVRKDSAAKGFGRLNKKDTELIIQRTKDIWIPYWTAKYVRNGKWISTEFIPHPASYINGRLFADDPPIVDDQAANEQQQLKIKEDRLIKEQREQEAYLRRAEALAPKTDEDFKDVKSSIGEALKNLRSKHTQA